MTEYLHQHPLIVLLTKAKAELALAVGKKRVVERALRHASILADSEILIIVGWVTRGEIYKTNCYLTARLRRVEAIRKATIGGVEREQEIDTVKDCDTDGI